MEDNWKHRSEKMKCKTCMWFVLKEAVPVYVIQSDVPLPPDIGPGQIIEGVTSMDNPESNIGRCRRHAPTMNGYPVVFRSDWCGDHKLDEGKL